MIIKRYNSCHIGLSWIKWVTGKSQLKTFYQILKFVDVYVEESFGGSIAGFLSVLAPSALTVAGSVDVVSLTTTDGLADTRVSAALACS